MPLTIRSTFYTDKNTKNSFKGLTKLKYSQNFNPFKNKNDYLAIRTFLTAKNFKQLFEKANVKASFEKIESENSPLIRTILRYSYTPLKTKNKTKESIAKRVLSVIKKHFIDDETKHEWIEGWENKVTGESNLIYKKIMKVSNHNIKNENVR